MSVSPLKHYTSEELALGDGKEGRPALVGYKGKVYDCTASKLWKNGKHVNAHHAGQDLTASMDSAPHMEDVMGRFPVVGTLGEKPASAVKYREAPALIAWLLAQHPHPITAHFPVALNVIGALLTAYVVAANLAPLPGERGDLGAAAWYMVLFGSVLGLPAICTGLLSWWFNYGGVINTIYRWKLIFSGLLIVLACFSIALGWPAAQHLEVGSGAYWAYSLCVLAQAPTVLILGRLGGKIVYP